MLKFFNFINENLQRGNFIFDNLSKSILVNRR